MSELIRREKTSALMVTHDIETAIAVGDRVDVLSPNAEGARISARYTLSEFESLDPLARRHHDGYGTRFAEMIDSYCGSLTGRGKHKCAAT